MDANWPTDGQGVDWIDRDGASYATQLSRLNHIALAGREGLSNAPLDPLSN